MLEDSSAVKLVVKLASSKASSESRMFQNDASGGGECWRMLTYAGHACFRMTRAEVNGEIENVYYTGAKLRAHFNRLVTFFFL